MLFRSVRLTEDTLRESGIAFERASEGVWRVPGRQAYHFRGGREVEGDWSQAAFFLAMGVGVDVLRDDSRQGDRAVVGLLAAIDAAPPEGVTLDISQTPDLYPVLAAYAAATGRSVAFTGTERLRLKESDRIASTAALIESVRRGETVRTFGDHRIAMSAAVMACYSERPVVVDDPDCVAKSYHAFWDDFDALCV